MRNIEELKQAKREVRAVSLRLLRTDGGTQYRQGIDEETMLGYLMTMKDGAVFPPIEAVFDGQYYWVFDGFHRLAAYSRLGTPSIQVSAIRGTCDEAQLLAMTANATHGLPRDHHTKKRIGLAALEHPAFAGSSAYKIAKACGLSEPFIRGLRDPEAKARQQEARDRSFLNRIKPEVANPIGTSDPQAVVEPVPEQVSAGPSEEEIQASQLAFEADMATMYKILESDGALKELAEENKRLNLRLAQLELRLRGLMEERNEAVRLIKAEQRRCKRLEIELRGYRRSRVEIALDAEVKARQSMMETKMPG